MGSDKLSAIAANKNSYRLILRLFSVFRINYETPRAFEGTKIYCGRGQKFPWCDVFDSFGYSVLLQLLFLVPNFPMKKTILLSLSAVWQLVTWQVGRLSSMLTRTKTELTEAQQRRLAKWNLVVERWVNGFCESKDERKDIRWGAEIMKAEARATGNGVTFLWWIIRYLINLVILLTLRQYRTWFNLLKPSFTWLFSMSSHFWPGIFWEGLTSSGFKSEGFLLHWFKITFNLALSRSN